MKNKIKEQIEIIRIHLNVTSWKLIWEKYKKRIILAVLLCFVVVLFLCCYFFVIINSYNETLNALNNKNSKLAYQKIGITKTLCPYYKDVQALYKKAKAFYYLDLMAEASNKKDYVLALVNLKKADTGHYALDVIQSYRDYIDFLSLRDKAIEYYNKMDYDNSLKYAHDANLKDFSMIFDKKYLTVTDKNKKSITYKSLKTEHQKFIKEINSAIKKRRARFNYLKEKMYVEQDKIESFNIIRHPSSMLGNYTELLSLCFTESNGKIEKLAFFLNHPSEHSFLYINKIIFNIDGEKLEIFIPQELPIRLNRPVYILNTYILTETMLLKEDFLGDKIHILINKIPKSKTTYMRLVGQEERFDREITSEEKQAIAEVYEYYYYKKVFNLN